MMHLLKIIKQEEFNARSILQCFNINVCIRFEKELKNNKKYFFSYLLLCFGINVQIFPLYKFAYHFTFKI